MFRMKPSVHTESIDVADLRVGMFVHLDVGWMSHPFPLSSFRIASGAQIDTIRGLGLERVRWSPAQSDAGESGDAAVEATDAVAEAAPPALVAANDAILDDEAPDGGEPSAPAAAAGADGPAAPPSAARAARLARQAEAKRVCEQQYAEATRDCRHAFETVEARPRDAREQVERLTRALVDKMIDAGEVCVRVLSEGATERASMHAMNVGIVSLLMGRSLGLPEEELHDIGVGALLHDVGKLALPMRLRWRDETFSPGEVRVWEEHVAHGVAQARRMGLSAGAATIIEQHHEHADGSGFPEHVNADRMSLGSRIVALVNSYDNLCNPRVVTKALTPHEALSQMFAQGRARYDAPILSAFIRMMTVYPPGSMVQLTDDRYASVVSVNASRPLKPTVLIFDPKAQPDETLAIDLESLGGVGIRRSLRPAHLPPPVLDWLQPASRVAWFFEPVVEREPA